MGRNSHTDGSNMGMKMPQNWRIEIIRPIHKKGGKMHCSYYRGISLLNVCYKVSSNVLKRLLVPYAE